MIPCRHCGAEFDPEQLPDDPAVQAGLVLARERYNDAGKVCADHGPDHQDHKFGEAFGVRIKELGLLTRAVFVFDKSGKCVYAEYVPEVTHEPNYDAALSAIKAAL